MSTTVVFAFAAIGFFSCVNALAHLLVWLSE